MERNNRRNRNSAQPAEIDRKWKIEASRRQSVGSRIYEDWIKDVPRGVYRLVGTVFALISRTFLPLFISDFHSSFLLLKVLSNHHNAIDGRKQSQRTYYRLGTLERISTKWAFTIKARLFHASKIISLSTNGSSRFVATRISRMGKLSIFGFNND